MNRRTMPLVLMLVAGAFTCIITFINNFSLFGRMLTLLIVLLVFYFLGSCMKWALDYFDSQNEELAKENENEEGEVIEKDMEVESEEQQESEEEE